MSTETNTGSRNRIDFTRLRNKCRYRARLQTLPHRAPWNHWELIGGKGGPFTPAACDIYQLLKNLIFWLINEKTKLEYYADADCRWLVEAPSGYLVEWRLPRGYEIAGPCGSTAHTQAMQRAGGCSGTSSPCGEELSVYEIALNGERSARPIWERCGNSKRLHQGRSVKSNRVEIVWRSDSYRRRRAFAIDLRIAPKCGSTIRVEGYAVDTFGGGVKRARFTDKRGNYADNLLCEWDYRAASGCRLSLELSGLRGLSHGDRLSVFGGVIREENTRGKGSASLLQVIDSDWEEATTTVRSTGPDMALRFEADMYSSGKLFNAEVSVCKWRFWQCLCERALQ